MDDCEPTVLRLRAACPYFEALADGGHDLLVYGFRASAGIHHEKTMCFAAGDGEISAVNAVEKGAALALEAVFVRFAGIGGHARAVAATSAGHRGRRVRVHEDG